MRADLFNKWLVSLVFLLLILTTAVNLHSVLSFHQPSDWNYRELQRIDKAPTDFSFVVFGDNKNSAGTFADLIDKVNKERVDFAVDLGDLVFAGENEYFRFFLRQAERMNKPLLTVVGNHELRDGGRANYYDIFGRFYYAFTVGDSRFIILDDASEEGLDPWQMDWLKNELQESQHYRCRFVFMHVPLYDPRKVKQPGHSLRNVTRADELSRLFDQYSVTTVFCSHIHAYYRGTWNKTPYIITGGAGAELDGTDPEHYFYHYIKVHVSKSGVTCEVVKLKSPDFELADRLLHIVLLYGYALLDIHGATLVILVCLLYLGYYMAFVREKWLIFNDQRRQ